MPPKWNGRWRAPSLARDLINTPPNDLGPDAFEKEIRAFAARHKMKVKAIVGDDLLKQNFPMIHAVGRASAEAPRLLDLSWGRASDPKITLVGKGVTFDTGGLDIKPSAGMLLMKKDMGGAANVLGLAHAIMDAKLKVRLRVLIPVVENAISAIGLPPRRYPAVALRPDRRDRQHRCRGPADSRRCADAWRRGEPRTDARHGDADRRGAHGAWPRSAAALFDRRRAGAPS